MAVFSAAEFDGIFYFEYTICSFDDTAVAFLTAHGSVERSFLYENGSLLAFHQRFCNLSLCRQNGYFGGILQMIVSGKLSCYGRVDLIVNGCISTHVVCYFTARSCTLSLLFHCCMETVLVDAVALLLEDLFGQIQRESVGIVQFECILSVQNFFAFALHFFFELGEDMKSLVDGFVELGLLVVQNVEDEVFFLFKFRISVFGSFDYACGKAGKEQSVNAKQTAMTCCTADQTAQYVASSFVGRHDSIGNHECCGTDMVCDKADGNIGLMIFLILFSGDFAYFVAECLNGVDIEDGIYILYDNGQTLKSHTGINVLLDQVGVVALAVVVELAEYVVPYFHVTVTLAANGTSRFAAAVFFSAVIINLRTRTARTCAMLPEVVLFSKTENTVCRDADLFVPDIKCFIIVLIDGWVQTIRIEPYYLC